MTDAEMKTLLAGLKTIAVIGAKDKEGQPVDGVGRYLLRAGYTVLPVHPARKDVWGLHTYAKLDDLPPGLVVDAVVLFRASEHCAAHAREALRLSPLPKVFWMQEGIACPESGALMEAAGVAVVENLCIKKEHKRLLAGSPLGKM